MGAEEELGAELAVTPEGLGSAVCANSMQDPIKTVRPGGGEVRIAESISTVKMNGFF